MLVLPLLFNTVLVFWALWAKRQLSRLFDNKISWIVGGFLLLVLPYVGGQTLLNETFVAISSCSLIILLITLWLPENTKIHPKDIWLFSFFLGACVLSSYAYIPFGLFMFIFGLWSFVKKMEKAKRIKQIVKFLAICLTPYLLLLIYLFVTGTLEDFVFATYTFNKQYYSPFVNYPKTIFGWFFVGFKNAGRLLWQLITELSIRTVLAIASISSIFSAVVFGIRKNQKALAFLLIGAFIFLTTRLFSLEHVISNGYGAHHTSAGVLLLSIICFTILADWTFQTKRLINKMQVLETFLTFGIFIVFFSIFGFYSFILSMRIGLFDTTIKPHLACVINQLTDKNDYVWLGPYIHYDELFIQAKHATRYSYFFPLHAACLECKNEFVNQILTQKPKVIGFNPEYAMFNLKAKDYLPEINTLLNEYYWKFENPKVNDLYLLKTINKESAIKAVQTCN
ncbi:MAG: hypothetical protein WCT08_05130 [Patescibacteria group bacterium]